jgi:hypothetical protein
MLVLAVIMITFVVCVLLAAAKHVDPYLWIPQLMHQPERSPVAKKHRKEVRLFVALMKGKKPFVRELTGTQYQGQEQLKTYWHIVKKKRKQYTGLSSQEYTDCIKAAFDNFFPSRTGRGVPSHLVLIHDKCTSHLAKDVQRYCAQRSPKPIELVTIPTESPDLTPCDSAFFAVAKRRWRQLTNYKDMPWDERAKKFVKCVKDTVPDPFIDEMPLRWQACEQEQGYHIEEALRELKECE